jgi:tRNA threonylcarbamoyladenosine biosynthesis protein TsaE
VPPSAKLELSDPAATQELGGRLAQLLFPNAIVALVGPLGAGKTFLVRSIALGLGVTRGQLVTSPTFVLIQEYIGRLPIYHFDAYRLANPREFFDLGVSEYFEADGVCLIEWADRVEEHLPTEHLRITLHATAETSRVAELEPRGPKYEALVHELRSAGIRSRRGGEGPR